MSSKKKCMPILSLKTFIEEFSDFLTSFDGIEFSKWILLDDTQTKNGVEFRILDNFIITFTIRKTSTYYWDYVIKYQDTTLCSDAYAYGVSSGDSISRCYCRVSTNKRVVNIAFSDRNHSEQIKQSILFILTDNNNSIAGNIKVSTSPPYVDLSNTSLKLSDTSGVHDRNIPARCVYFNGSEKDDIEIIMNKAICEGTIKVDTTSGLYDCSTVSPDTVYMFDNQRYYAIDAHTLMPV